MDRGKPMLESLPTEIQLAILRHFLHFTKGGHIVLTPCFQNRSQRFSNGELALPGISGILRASKHLSNLALGVLYGENLFLVCEDSYDFTKSSHCNDEEYLRRKDMNNSPWSNLRNHTNEELKSVSSVECLDLISQTTSGRTMLHKLIINLGTIVMMRTLTGVLPRILRRLRGLQHIEFRLSRGWDAYSATAHHDGCARFGQGFLQLVKRELGHVKTIIINDDQTIGSNEGVSSWMAFELLKRNKVWVPPSSACKNFRATSSPFQYFSKEIMEEVLEKEHYIKKYWNLHDTRGNLEDKFGVF